MKTPGIVFMALVLVLALALAAASPPEGDNGARGSSSVEDLGTAPRRSRFLASAAAKPRTIKCDRSPFVCRYPGSAGPDCCNGRCVDMGSNVNNCGACGTVCKFTEACCKGKCVDLNYDKRHCGRCFNKCHKGVLCIYGMCKYA